MKWPLLAASVAPMTFWKEGWGSVRMDAACPARTSSCMMQDRCAYKGRTSAHEPRFWNMLLKGPALHLYVLVVLRYHRCLAQASQLQ